LVLKRLPPMAQLPLLFKLFHASMSTLATSFSLSKFSGRGSQSQYTGWIKSSVTVTSLSVSP